jgi:hypothetical protein
MDAELHGYGDRHAHGKLDSDRHVDSDCHGHCDTFFDGQLDPHGYSVQHLDCDGDQDSDRYRDLDGDLICHAYRHGDECPVGLSSRDDVGPLSQPGDQSVLADPVRPAVELSQDVALGHHHECEPYGGFRDSVCFR